MPPAAAAATGGGDIGSAVDAIAISALKTMETSKMPYFWIVLHADISAKDKAQCDARSRRSRYNTGAKYREDGTQRGVELVMRNLKELYRFDPSILFARIDGETFERYAVQRLQRQIRIPSLWLLNVLTSEYKEYTGVRTTSHLADYVNSVTGHTARPKNTPKGYETLTTSNFDAVAYNPLSSTLVIFSKQLCSRCDRALFELQKAAAEIAEDDGSIVLAHIDVTSSPEFASKYGVIAYPSARYFPRGESKRVFYYDHALDFETIGAFIAARRYDAGT